MKRLVKVSMCFLLMLGLSGIQGVQAEGNSAYTGDAEEDDFKILVVSENEINLKANEVACYHINENGQTQGLQGYVEPEDIRNFQVGFKDEQGNIKFDHKIDVRVDNWNIAMVGVTARKVLFDFDKNYDYAYTEDDLTFHKYLNDWKLGTDSKYITYDNYGDLMDYITEISGIGADYGGATGPDDTRGIVPIRAGTTYVTFSYGTQSVKVKVNVSNLNDEPMEKLPSGIADEFYSDANEKVNVTLNNPDTVTSDIFKASKETGKDVTFNVLGENNKTKYAWTFNGSTITNPDMDLDLSLMFDSDKKKEIESLAKDTNLFYLNFAHHGNLPGVANMKVDVSSKYKDGEEIYLYYYNEEKGTVEQTSEKVVVKDGYAEFDISHCSTYFFTTNPIENAVDNTTSKKDDSNAIKATSQGGMNSTQGIAISLLALVIVGTAVTMKRKHS